LRGQVFIVLAHPEGSKAYIVGVFASPYAANAQQENWIGHKAGTCEVVPLWVINGNTYDDSEVDRLC
jgi:hypothetical protein